MGIVMDIHRFNGDFMFFLIIWDSFFFQQLMNVWMCICLNDHVFFAINWDKKRIKLGYSLGESSTIVIHLDKNIVFGCFWVIYIPSGN